MHNFKKLNVWQKSMDLAVNVYKMTDSFPKEERFGLISQMRKATASIPSLIAAGPGRNSNKEFSNFLGMAVGSCYELETQAILSQQLGYSNETITNKIVNECIFVSKMLTNLIKTYKS